MSLLGSNWGAGWSDLSEQITIENKTGSPLDLHFFQYNNYTLSGGQDTVIFDNNNHVTQTGPLQNQGEISVSGTPRHEGALVSTTLNSLNDNLPSTLSNGMGSVGPGNVSCAFEWDISIATGRSASIGIDKLLNVVPEPSAIVLLSGGVMGIVLLQLRKRNGRLS
jgi:hypothetical protein